MEEAGEIEDKAIDESDTGERTALVEFAPVWEEVLGGISKAGTAGLEVTMGESSMLIADALDGLRGAVEVECSFSNDVVVLAKLSVAFLELDGDGGTLKDELVFESIDIWVKVYTAVLEWDKQINWFYELFK